MSASVQWLGDQEAKPAPGMLRRVQGLINTIDRESGEDRLADPRDAQPWLLANALLTPGQVPSEADMRVVVDFREALRALVVHQTAGADQPLDSGLVAHVRALVEDVPLRAAIGPDGRISVSPVDQSVRSRLAGLLLIVAAAQRDGTWAHLKACANEDCRWAFYDRSRNHGGTWCDMSTCGNKLKNRDFRARKRAVT